MQEEKEKNNFRIHLKGNKYIIGNGLCYYIAQEVKQKKTDEDGSQKTYYKRLSGYHTNLLSLCRSYERTAIKNAEIDGEMDDLMQLILKVHKETISLMKKAAKAIEKYGQEGADD